MLKSMMKTGATFATRSATISLTSLKHQVLSGLLICVENTSENSQTAMEITIKRMTRAVSESQKAAYVSFADAKQVVNMLSTTTAPTRGKQI
jgi:hypothetical protein